MQSSATSKTRTSCETSYKRDLRGDISVPLPHYEVERKLVASSTLVPVEDGLGNITAVINQASGNVLARYGSWVRSERPT